MFIEQHWVGRWGGVAYMTNDFLSMCIGDQALEYFKEVEKQAFTMSHCGVELKDYPREKRASPNGKWIVTRSMPMTPRSSILKMVGQEIWSGALAKRKQS
jgi:hypothetical protein